MSSLSVDFSMEDLRRDIRYACLKGPGDPASTDVLDPFGFISQPAILRRLGLWIAAEVPEDGDRLVAAGTSALGLGLAGALELNVPVVLVEGTDVLGDVSDGDQVVLVADITYTGETAIRSVKALGKRGATTVQIIVIWDRNAGGLDAIRTLGISMSVFMTEASYGATYER